MNVMFVANKFLSLSLSLAPVNPDWFYLSGVGSPW